MAIVLCSVIVIKSTCRDIMLEQMHTKKSNKKFRNNFIVLGMPTFFLEPCPCPKENWSPFSF